MSEDTAPFCPGGTGRENPPGLISTKNNFSENFKLFYN
jgi:hypothetical protein